LTEPSSRRHNSLVVGFPLASFSALLTAAVAATRCRQIRVTHRRVTLEDVESLTIFDVPRWFTKRLSIAKARRDAVVISVRERLEDVFFVMAFNKDSMETPELEAARAMFPETTIVRVLKNTLVRRAMLGTPWEPFAKHIRGANMFVFVLQDTDLKPTIQAYLKLEKKFNREAKVAEVYEKVKGGYTFQLRPLVGGCLRDEWNYIPPEDFAKLKDFPTKSELIAKIAGGIKQITQRVAVGVNQVPQKIAIGTKKIVEKMEEDGKSTVGDAVA